MPIKRKQKHYLCILHHEWCARLFPHILGRVYQLYLKVLLHEVAPLAQALHDRFVAEDVLLTEVLPPFPGLQHKSIHQVEICQEVSYSFLHERNQDINDSQKKK